MIQKGRLNFRRPLIWLRLVGNCHQAGVTTGSGSIDTARNFFKYLQDVQTLFGRQDTDERTVAAGQLLFALAAQRLDSGNMADACVFRFAVDLQQTVQIG